MELAGSRAGRPPGRAAVGAVGMDDDDDDAVGGGWQTVHLPLDAAPAALAPPATAPSTSKAAVAVHAAMEPPATVPSSAAVGVHAATEPPGASTDATMSPPSLAESEHTTAPPPLTASTDGTATATATGMGTGRVVPIDAASVGGVRRATGVDAVMARQLLDECGGSGQRAVAAHLARVWGAAAPPALPTVDEAGPARLLGMENAGNRYAYALSRRVPPVPLLLFRFVRRP